ncbi:MAG: FAD-dependent oxidoreductase [Pirellulales bacterium]|nr:FAD-dependent oxidoreductase [Pirellulales bacterium]
MRIAVVGAGVSGLTAARLLAAHHDVTLFEAGASLGGHAQTVDFVAYDRPLAADVGFMVFNDRTYPNFLRLLRLLGISPQASDMSFAVRSDGEDFEYQGSSLDGLFAQRGNLLRPRFWRMLADILRFNRRARQADPTAGVTLLEFVDSCGVGDCFWRHYLLPMTAAIWSAPAEDVAAFPAAFLLRFFQNHGLLDLRNRPQWMTVPGGSRRYVEALARPLTAAGRVRVETPVERVVRAGNGVEITPQGGDPERFDGAVLATHAPQTLAMLADATPDERNALSAFPYHPNRAVLHTDASFLPRRRRAWASWNYLATGDPRRPVAVTYDLNRLQRLGAPGPICLTLNPPREVAPEHYLAEFSFAHPLYTHESLAAQARHDSLHADGRVVFAGAYWGSGFHEDGVTSALTACRRWGVFLDDFTSCTVASTAERSSTLVAAP